MPGLGISAAQLAQMRAQTNKLMPDTCTLTPPTKVSDGAGGTTTTYRPQDAVSSACRLDPLLSNAATATTGGEREIIKNQWMLTLPYNATFGADWQVGHGGKTYEIQMLADDHSWNVDKRAVVTRVD